MSTDNTVRDRSTDRKLAWAPAVALLSLLTVGCSDSYEPTKVIEGMYQPTMIAPDGSHCVQIEGRRDEWPSFPKSQPIICEQIRVSEIGVMTFGSELAQPGLKLEVARLEFSDASVFIPTKDLRDTGRFEFRERSPTLEDWARHHPFSIAALALVTLAVPVTILLRAQAKASRRRRAAAKAAAKAAAEADALAKAAAKVAANAAARAAILAKLRPLVADGNGAANSLPIILGEAEITLDRAQAELKSQLPSPFWEAMEEVVDQLRAFHYALSIIDSRRTQYRTQAAQLERDVPTFTLGVSVLPDPADTQGRLNRLYREAQAIPHFSIVYEQRRTTATLIVGFRSLGQTIERFGDRISDEISSLANSLDCRLGNLESSLESSAAAAAEQSAALRAQLESAVGVNEAVRGQLRQDAEARSETERLALRMLDNIQRRRKPTIFDRP